MIQLLIKLAIIATVTAISFALVAWLLLLSNAWPMQVLALAVWSCGAVPAIYLTWRIELRREP